MYEVLMLIKLGIIVVVLATVVLLYKLHQLYQIFLGLQQDLRVIRLDNIRTMAEMRRKQRR